MHLFVCLTWLSSNSDTFYFPKYMEKSVILLNLLLWQSCLAWGRFLWRKKKSHLNLEAVSTSALNISYHDRGTKQEKGFSWIWHLQAEPMNTLICKWKGSARDTWCAEVSVGLRLGLESPPSCLNNAHARSWAGLDFSGGAVQAWLLPEHRSRCSLGRFAWALQLSSLLCSG